MNMNWRDLLYFSKGEKQALTVLLCLITLAWLTLLITEDPQSTLGENTDSTDTIYGTSAMRKPINPPVKLYNYGKSGKPKESKPVSNKSRSTSSPRTSANDPSYKRTEKYPTGTIIELNTADTTILKKVPGIGSSFAQRIIKFRDLLGGFYSVSQLSEVYGIDSDRYEAMKSWFIVDSTLVRKLTVNQYPTDSFPRHPYLSFRQARAIIQLRQQHKNLDSWNNLRLLEEFTETDRQRLEPYLSFK